MLSPSELADFRPALLSWYRQFRRDLPWRRTSDPYAIWVSEIMLQQTRVAAATGYYLRFIARFPDFSTLAETSESELLTHWAGLGYYYRARNLWAAAKEMVAAGRFPSNYVEIRNLPGVGDYTAAAVASIAFGLPHAVVDGNVLRVLSRILADSTNPGSALGRKHFAKTAEAFLDGEQPGDYNQAVMELGASICLPRNPQCLLCPVARWCRARADGTPEQFPVKAAPAVRPEELRTLYWIERDGRILAWQRPPNSRLMPGFWELPELEQLPAVVPRPAIGSFRHGITVHNYRFQIIVADPPADLGGCSWIDLELKTPLPISTVFRKARTWMRTHRNSRYAVHVVR